MRKLRLLLYGFLGLVGPLAVTNIVGQSQPIQPLAANDVSWLFPPPKSIADLDKLIAMSEFATIWPDAVFQQFLKISSESSQVAGTSFRIGLPDEAKLTSNWFIAGVRIDAGAPGLSDEINAQFGRSPQIRLIIQLVTRDQNQQPIVRDITGHLVFDFVKTRNAGAKGCLPLPVPDNAEFNKIVRDLADLKGKLATGQFGTDRVITSGNMGVHPGLTTSTTAIRVRQEMKDFLTRHITADRLDAMAIMGLPAGQNSPWIFLSMANVTPGTSEPKFMPVPGPTLVNGQVAQMLQVGGSVVPISHSNNLTSITCSNAAAPGGLPESDRNGLSVADLSGTPHSNVDMAIIRLIEDPERSHFFNIDCVSCHVESRRAMNFQQMQSVSGLDSNLLTSGPYDVRNFGWSTDGAIKPTVTRRVFAETKAVVDFINSPAFASGLSADSSPAAKPER